MPDNMRNESAIKHMLEYCVEIERTLSEISWCFSDNWIKINRSKKVVWRFGMIKKTLSFVVLLVFVVISCSAFVFADEKQKFESYDVTDSESTLIQGYTDDDAEILNEDYPEEYQNEDSADKLPIESFEEEYYVTFEDNEG